MDISVIEKRIDKYNEKLDKYVDQHLEEAEDVFYERGDFYLSVLRELRKMYEVANSDKHRGNG